MNLTKLLQKPLIGGTFYLLYAVTLVTISGYIAIHHLNAGEQFTALFEDPTLKDGKIIWKLALKIVLVTLGLFFNMLPLSFVFAAIFSADEPNVHPKNMRYHSFIYIPIKCMVSLLLLNMQTQIALVLFLTWELYVLALYCLFYNFPAIRQTAKDEYWLLMKEQV